MCDYGAGAGANRPIVSKGGFDASVPDQGFDSETLIARRRDEAYRAMVEALRVAEVYVQRNPGEGAMELWQMIRAALADVRDGCDRKTRRCVVCWYGPECGPFYGVQRVTIDEERPCPCACHRRCR